MALAGRKERIFENNTLFLMILDHPKSQKWKKRQNYGHFRETVRNHRSHRVPIEVWGALSSNYRFRGQTQ
jgi:hypothetical protein